MKDYNLMTSDQLHKEYKKLNRRLILPNFLIAIIAAIACFAQMFMPFFSISVTLNGDAVASVVDMVYAEDEDIEIDSDNAILTAVLTKDNVKKMTSTLNTTVSVELKGTDLLSLAFASDDAVEDEVVSLIVGVVASMNIKDVLETALNDMMPTVVSVAVTETIKTLSEDLELDEETVAIIDDCATSIETAVQKLAEAETVTEEVKEEVKTDVKTSVAEAMTAAGYTDEDYESVSDTIDEYFDAFVDAATDDEGNFSYVTMIENIDTLIESLSSSGEVTDEELEDILGELTGGDGTEDLTEEDLDSLIEGITGGDSTDGTEEESYANTMTAVRHTLTADETDGSSTSTDDGSSSDTATLSYYISLLDDPEALVEELLGESGFDDDTLQIIKLVSMGLFIFLAVISALWAILVLLSLLHIFLPNKKVGMWYVKLFGGTAAVIFFLIPIIAMLLCKLIPTVLADTLALDSAIFTTIASAVSFGGAEIIVLICLLALWFVSIFICHPIKKRIKKCKNALKQVAP